MSTRTRHSPLDRLHAHTKATRTARRRAYTAGSQGLDLAARYPVGYFGSQHGLTPAQAWEAQQLLNRANRLRPIRGRHAERRHRLRISGIISAVLGGRVGSSAFGRRLHGHRGGRVMAMHGAHILAENRGRILARRRALRAVTRRQATPETPFEAWQRALATPTLQREPQQPDFMTW